jgi:hypothetical protein
LKCETGQAGEAWVLDFQQLRKKVNYEEKSNVRGNNIPYVWNRMLDN